MTAIKKNTKGIVFDIHRFSLNDGPGIRTTIFLKGCPLNCTWCHNPEAKEFKPQLSFNLEKCNHCFSCVVSCSNGVHLNNDGVHEIIFESCILNGACVDTCPNLALEIVGEKYSVENIIELILRDKLYYDNSGGGITLSGGEPLAQFKFAKEILTQAKCNNIHTTVETCGHLNSRQLIEIIPLVDLFLFDYKETDAIKHEHLTGKSNTLILNNLDVLMQRKANVILRCPLISEINDSTSHLRGITEICEKYPLIKEIEIMPFHDTGRNKARKIGKENKLYNQKTTSEKSKKYWVETLKKFNCNKVKLAN